jgi:hypothetical protein
MRFAVTGGFNLALASAFRGLGWRQFRNPRIVAPLFQAFEMERAMNGREMAGSSMILRWYLSVGMTFFFLRFF